MGWESALQDAKKGHRPRLKDWARDRFATGRAAEFEALASRMHKNEGSARCKIAVEHASSMTPETFVSKYESTNTPVLIKGIVDEEEWPARRRWTLQRLKEDFRDRKFKCGEDDDGYTIRVTMRNFTKYIENQVDDSPLYIFDSTFDDDFSAQRLLDDYKVPKYFPSNPDQDERFGHTRESDTLFDPQAKATASSSGGGGGGGGGSSAQSKNATPKAGTGVGYHDLFSLVGERRRPPYRWMLLGPKRSGTCVHTDPLASSAWNTSVQGRKLWVLFPPGTPKSVVKAKKVIRDGEDDEAINYFVDLLPRLAKAHPTLEMYEFIAGEGDTVFVPGGWWHAVLNLDDTVAVTQNFCSKQNFAKVWRETRSGRKKMAVKWLRKLHELHPDLAVTAERLNAEDGFTMPFNKKIAHDADAATGEGGRGGDGGKAEERKDERGRSSKKNGKKEKKKSNSKSRSRSKSRGGGAESNQPASTSSSKSSVVFEKNSDGRKKHESSRDNYTSLPHDEPPNVGSPSDSSGFVDRVRLTCNDRSSVSPAAPRDTKSEGLSTAGQSGAGSRPTSESSGEGSDMSRVSSGVGSSSGRSSGGGSGDDEDCGVDGDKGQKRKIEAVTGALAGMMAAAGTAVTGAASK